ncbi:3-oxoacyl-ACP synthase [Ulvibacterium sp.]|uniref:3-oxoacyl-ACP synthase n=1 Tax=Ulvibacterium sp. TaxID=2665914 RepID=UPI003CC5FFDC
MPGISKKDLFEFCETFVTDRIARVRKNMVDIQEALTSETKSSAGDKHETGRAMLQLEREKLGHQLAQAEGMKLVLTRVLLQENIQIIGLGSCAITSKGNYFLAISAGVYVNKDISIFCISMGTPIGKLLFGKRIGDVVVFQGEKIEILEIK